MTGYPTLESQLGSATEHPRGNSSGLRAGGTDFGHCWVWFLSGQITDTGTVRHIPIHASPFVIGRRNETTLCLPSPTVSGLHAEIVELGDQLYLRDLNSTNGTYVNGQRIREPIALQPDDLVQIASFAFRVSRQSADASAKTVAENVCDKALALVQFDKMMTERAVLPFYQPIVELQSGTTVAFEVLGRSPFFGLETPAAMFYAASQLDLEVELSNMFRWEGISLCAAVDPQIHLFVNTHPAEMQKEGLVQSMRAVREVSPEQPITLELHEAAVTDAPAISRLRDELAAIDVKLAYDDFGAGQTRLVELVEVRPDYLKFDMNLIRDIDRAGEQRQRMLATLVQMTRELGIAAIAEGVETQGEADTCRQLGFDLGQGFHFGWPAPITYLARR